MVSLNCNSCGASLKDVTPHFLPAICFECGDIAKVDGIKFCLHGINKGVLLETLTKEQLKEYSKDKRTQQIQKSFIESILFSKMQKDYSHVKTKKYRQ